MRDHQLFEETVLSNGITVYTYQDRFRVASMEIILPVGAGHSHSANNFIPGSAHFLEHVQLIRSRKFPLSYQLDQELGLRGGHGDGTTYPTYTCHWTDTPAQELNFTTDALIDRVFYPIFNEEDIGTERTVVINERNQHKFYPGKSEASQYFYREFINDIFYPIEQIFGSDQDLEVMDVATLTAMHQRISQSRDIKVLAVGPSDFSQLKQQLADLPTHATSFKAAIAPTTWGKKDFHFVYYDTVAQPTLKVAWIHPRLNYEEFQAVSFVVSLLINATHGPLYHELREEKGWVYDIDGFSIQREHTSLCGFTFPVNKVEQVEYIREGLHERIVAACANQTLVEHEIIRYLRNQVYNYQTVSEIIGSASQDLMTYGKIYTEKEWLEAVQKMADPTWREMIVSQFFAAEKMGSLCFMPERRRSVPVRDLPSTLHPIAAQPRAATIKDEKH